MTLRIIGVNVIAVFSLIIGVVYLGQYHSSLVENKLEQFHTESLLVTTAIGEAVLSDEADNFQISEDKAKELSARIGLSLNKRILIFDHTEKAIADSDVQNADQKYTPLFQLYKYRKPKLKSIEILKSTAGWIASFFPQYSALPLYEGIHSSNVSDYPDSAAAMGGTLVLSAWRDYDGNVVLTALVPMLKDSGIAGYVMIASNDDEIKAALADTWFNILKIFLVTFIITIALSIYLSGVIARPLRILATAAENVRKGKLKHTEIPDMSDRHDEIGELSIVLRDMTYALWERMDSIESFAADVAHEIKNPLTSLKSAVETASIVKKKSDLNKLLGVIKHDIERLDRLISDISSMSRLDAELSREKFEVVDIKKVLRQLIDSYKSPLERNTSHTGDKDTAMKDGVIIKLDLPARNDVYVLGSEGRIIQVFQNILSNALSFSPIKSTIKISAEVKGRKVKVTIQDQGPGIPEKQLKKVFDRFYSERPKHEEYGNHSGLGLAICKQIITAHNGLVYAENKEDRSGDVKGAEFTIILNLVKV
jgi:two-component system sensor histidine kinase ChvG